MRNVIKIIAGLALIGSIAWFIADRSYEPLVTSLGALATLIGLFVTEERGNRNKSVKSQDLDQSEGKAESTQTVRSITPTLGSLSGNVDIKISPGSIHEVFYKKPFRRTPHLEIKRGSYLSRFEIIEQRKDGFKIKSTDYYSLDFNWTAEGEFEN